MQKPIHGLQNNDNWQENFLLLETRKWTNIFNYSQGEASQKYEVKIANKYIHTNSS